jgi:hypothetical protein
VVGSKKFGGLRFSIKVGDHDPAHVHCVGAGFEIVFLLGHGTIRTREEKGSNASELRKARRIAIEHFDDLVKLWKDSRNA